MSYKIATVVLGQPKSTFPEIILKCLKMNVIKKTKIKLIFIGSEKLLNSYLKRIKKKFKINIIEKDLFQKIDLKKNQINLININFNNLNSIYYIDKCLETALNLIETKRCNYLINGPISKSHFLKGKYPGITEYLAKKTKTKNPVMLIYNNKVSVSPITTHIPLHKVSKEISIKKIINNTKLINNFYKTTLKKKPNIAITGLNPHCESFSKKNEEKNIILPAIKRLKKHNLKVYGPFPADTIFLKNNLKKYDVIVGMYHDQVLTPLKSIFNFKAINITIGLPFIRISPDHGPNIKMYGKNKSDPTSFKEAIIFLNKLSAN